MLLRFDWDSVVLGVFLLLQEGVCLCCQAGVPHIDACAWEVEGAWAGRADYRAYTKIREESPEGHDPTGACNCENAQTIGMGMLSVGAKLALQADQLKEHIALPSARAPCEGCGSQPALC